MVVIRLSRGGAKARPFFNIVVADKRTRRDGAFIERIGFYNPIATDKEESIRIAQDRLTYWKGVGARLPDGGAPDQTGRQEGSRGGVKLMAGRPPAELPAGLEATELPADAVEVGR